MKWLASSVGVLLACGLVFAIWYHANASIVAYRALAVAQDAALCLQRPSSTFEQKEVSHWSELSRKNLQSPLYFSTGSMDFYPQFHAVLVVDRGGSLEFYNWSYYYQNFLPISQRAIEGLHIQQSCEPSHRFFQNLQT
jgi:hypothetical protein